MPARQPQKPLRLPPIDLKEVNNKRSQPRRRRARKEKSKAPSKIPTTNGQHNLGVHPSGSVKQFCQPSPSAVPIPTAKPRSNKCFHGPRGIEEHPKSCCSDQQEMTKGDDYEDDTAPPQKYEPRRRGVHHYVPVIQQEQGLVFSPHPPVEPRPPVQPRRKKNALCCGSHMAPDKIKPLPPTPLNVSQYGRVHHLPPLVQHGVEDLPYWLTNTMPRGADTFVFKFVEATNIPQHSQAATAEDGCGFENTPDINDMYWQDVLSKPTGPCILPQALDQPRGPQHFNGFQRYRPVCDVQHTSFLQTIKEVYKYIVN